MLAGSIVVADWHGVGKADSTIKAYESYRAQHLKLIADGSIIVENGRRSGGEGHRLRLPVHRGCDRTRPILQWSDLMDRRGRHNLWGLGKQGGRVMAGIQHLSMRELRPWSPASFRE